MLDPGPIGEIVRDLTPGDNNPRNSEGAFLRLKNGDILFIYSRFKGNEWLDGSPCDLYQLRSRDGGRSFGEDALVLTCEQEDGVNIMSVSLLEMQNGDIGLFYLVKETQTLVRMYLRRSADDGKSWGGRVLCTPPPGFYVVNNDRVIRLTNGDLLIPAAFHRSGYYMQPGEMGNGFLDPDGQMMIFLSRDDGRTWRYTDHKCSLPYSAQVKSGLQEPGLVELSPGVIWAWARTDLGRQFETYSIDGGIRWSPVQPSRFTSPNSPLSMKRMPDGRLFAVWNPIPEYNGRGRQKVGTGGRSPLVCAVSPDNGQTFGEPVLLEKDEGRAFCYCAIFFTETDLLLGYCAGGQEDGSSLSRTRIRRIPLDVLGQQLARSLE